MNLKPVKTQFRLDQFDYRQIHREGDVAIYEQTKPETKILAYEVVRIQVSPRSPWTEPQFTHVEWYPKSEQWGEAGWTAHTKEEAFARLSKLLLKSNP